ncbi:MAG TPA: S41 family peptidase [Pyrinomonadaceae bacterium]|nr:S41 family peptidase [Pyrinomonadaceae bacterium]
MSRLYRPLSFLVLILFAFQLTAHGQEPPRGETAVAAAPPASKAGEEADRRRETFEIVWRTVKENHFDPRFGGVDWDAVRTEFAPRAAASRTDRELHMLLQQMLNRLGQSHFNIIPPEAIPSTGDDEEGEGDADADGARGAEKPHPHGSVYMAEHLTYGIGIDLRILGGAALVTRVEQGSSAERAGLRTGYVLRSIDGRPLSDILADIRLAAVYEPSARNQIPAEVIVGYVNGSPGTSVKLSFLDARNRLRRAVVPRERLRGELAPTSPTLPAQFVEFESRRLRGGVGYIRFNLFVAPVLDKFCAALRSMKDAPGVVIDLRGNRGGLLGLLYGMGGLLETNQTSFGVMRTRAGWHEILVTPQRSVYRGRLVVLIDAETQSAGEIFAGGLQASGRAVLVGQRSAGATLPSAAKELPTGAILQYAFADFVTANGNVIEGNGVVPNVSVRLARRPLLAGRDPQLEAALGAVNSREAASGVNAHAPSLSFTAAAEELREDAEGRAAVAKTDGGFVEAPKAAGVAPEVEPILAKYEEAVGGRAVFDKLSTRVSKGRIEGAYGGMKVSGTVEVLEKSPDRLLELVNVEGLGVVRRGFTGAYGYMQIPLSGYREMRGAELSGLRLEARSGWAADLRRLYSSMTLKGKEEVGGAEAFVVTATPADGPAVTLYFDAQTGLLLRRDRTYFEDYREVDGVKLPFRIRDDFSTITLTEVKHNLPLEDARFAEEKNCFTQ